MPLLGDRGEGSAASPGERRRLPVWTIAAAFAVAATAAAFAALRWNASASVIAAGFWFEDVSFALPPHAVATLGGPLAADDIASIKQTARSEVDRAFAGLRIDVSEKRDAFWRVQVLQSVRGRGPFANSGQALVLGPLGGLGSVSFSVVAISAVRYAPPETSRQAIVDAIGRGIGRAAVHEFAHQILGPTAMDNNTDPNSYEYATFERAAQYYGELHWAGAWPLLQRKIGQ
jgi:hypothetical protein